MRIRLPPPHVRFLISNCKRVHRDKRYFCSSPVRQASRRPKERPVFVPSPEQQKVVKLCRTQNVVVSARPGSGKTATAEAIVAANPDQHVAVLTYSRRLRLETSRRLDSYPNCCVFTFHEMAGRLFGDVIRNDGILADKRRETIEANRLPLWKGTPFDIIILDEFQDCTEILYWLSCCFILANRRGLQEQHPRIVVLGDERQSIFQFNGADSRYLTLAAELLGPMVPHAWTSIPLSQSFRLTHETVNLVNNAFLGGEKYIIGSRHGNKPIVLRCNPFRSVKLARKLSHLVERYGPENTAILAPSVRKRGPIQEVTNILAQRYKVPIAVQTDDENPLNDKVIKGKLCVSTIHQFKGSERDLVILFGINHSWFKYFGRSLNDNHCPNDVFVALTRAAEQLVLIHDEDEDLMPFVSIGALYENAEIVNITRNKEDIPPPPPPGRHPELGFTLPVETGVRDMVRHIRDRVLERIVAQYLSVRQASPPLPEDEYINLPGIVQSNKRKSHEAVSDLNGLVIVAACEHALTGTLGMVDQLRSPENDTWDQPPSDLQQYAAWLCRWACAYEAHVSGYLPRSIQLEGHAFDWISPDSLVLARERLKEQVIDPDTDLGFEIEVEEELTIADQKTRLRGRVDIVSTSDDGEAVWEVKCVTDLSNEHIVQVATYAFLLTKRFERVPRIVLFNVKDGEKLEITSKNGQAGLRAMVEDVLIEKYTEVGEIGDEEFTQACEKVRREVLRLANDGDDDPAL